MSQHARRLNRPHSPVAGPSHERSIVPSRGGSLEGARPIVLSRLRTGEGPKVRADPPIACRFMRLPPSAIRREPWRARATGKGVRWGLPHVQRSSTDDRRLSCAIYCGSFGESHLERKQPQFRLGTCDCSVCAATRIPCTAHSAACAMLRTLLTMCAMAAIAAGGYVGHISIAKVNPGMEGFQRQAA